MEKVRFGQKSFRIWPYDGFAKVRANSYEKPTLSKKHGLFIHVTLVQPCFLLRGRFLLKTGPDFFKTVIYTSQVVVGELDF